MPVQLEALLYNIILQLYAALHTGHGLDEAWPVLLGQALVAAEAGELAYMADVGGSVVLGRRCPSGDDVPDTVQPVLRGVSAQEAESRTETVFNRLELAEYGPLSAPPLGEYLTFPEGFTMPDVQRVVVLNLHVFFVV